MPSEDPLLSSTYAREFISAMQGGGAPSQNASGLQVVATAKHLVACEQHHTSCVRACVVCAPPIAAFIFGCSPPDLASDPSRSSQCVSFHIDSSWNDVTAAYTVTTPTMNKELDLLIIKHTYTSTVINVQPNIDFTTHRVSTNQTKQLSYAHERRSRNYFIMTVSEFTSA